MVVFVSDGARHTTMVPVDAVVAACEELPDRNRLIDVFWNDKRYSMFARDLRERCEPVE